ncbi:MBL fold metallo-hydrolase [Halorussus aquaticus]|uniref:MBL fold metallo-hydrolase n=1 Tax=Halorussus aquaticus TaxID=2953748 RepID=A0ABD5PZX5_9EURY|nr:MBL fold metallo-hydrolase [Halorussus aquaticus]
MRLSYQHANPSTGGGSYLLRFRDATRERTACVLVDSGVGVDIDSLLADDEYLVAVLLTHAHLDHYASLADSLRDGARVYAAEPTANVLEHVLTEGEKNYEIGTTDGVLDAVEPLDGWETLVADVEVSPVPAGHAPGGSGFVVRFGDGSRTNHLLFTGDFTTRRVAGYPGFRTDLPVDIDALFVNVSTTDDFEETLSESLYTLVERAQAGSSVLATASALTAVHYAYLLGHLGERLGDPIPVTLAGQCAKLYADLGYDVPTVEAVPVFDSASDLLERGTVTFAGPEVPTEGSARRLFGVVEDDSAATVVQLTGGATTPVDTATCTVYDFEVVNHPPLPAIDELVEEFDPIHVVAGHGPRRALRNFRGRYDERFVWASDDEREQVLYEDGRWSPPPWLSETAVQSIRARDWRANGARFGELVEREESLPAVVRVADPDLGAEGVEVERFEDRFGERDDATHSTETGTDGAASKAVDTETCGRRADGSNAGEPEATEPETAESGLSDSAVPDAAVTETERFRREVLGRLDDLEPTVSGARLRARVVDGGDDVTLLRLLDDADLEHGEEVALVLTESERE